MGDDYINGFKINNLCFGNGSAKTPIKGVDYFTEEDITEIVKRIEIEIGVDTYVHNQLTATERWEIQHNLGRRPSVTVVDSGENVVIGDITYLNDNEIVIDFMAPFSGKAYLN